MFEIYYVRIGPSNIEENRTILRNTDPRGTPTNVDETELYLNPTRCYNQVCVLISSVTCIPKRRSINNKRTLWQSAELFQAKRTFEKCFLMLPETVQINHTMHAMMMVNFLTMFKHWYQRNAKTLSPSCGDDQFLLNCFFTFCISFMAHSAVVKVEWYIAIDIAWLKPS